MGRRAPAPQRHRHHHRPVISFKELRDENKAASGECEVLLELSPPGPVVVRIIDFISNERQRLTAHCLVLNFKHPVARLLLRLPRYKDRKASAAETCPAPKLPGKSNNRAPPRRRRLRHSFSAADESAHGFAYPSTTADRNNLFYQGTCVAPDPSKATKTAAVRSLPIPASDKFSRIRPSSW